MSTTITDSDTGHGTEGLVKLIAGPAGPVTAAGAFHPHPPPVTPPAPSGPRTHGPKLKTPVPKEGARGFRKVTHAH